MRKIFFIKINSFAWRYWNWDPLQRPRLHRAAGIGAIASAVEAPPMVAGTALYLLDTNYFEQLLPGAGNAGNYAGVLGNPRTFGATLRHTF
jgi:hypothetical protein